MTYDKYCSEENLSAGPRRQQPASDYINGNM